MPALETFSGAWPEKACPRFRSPPYYRLASLRVDRERWKRELEQLGAEAALKGTILLAEEGINETISAHPPVCSG